MKNKTIDPKTVGMPKSGKPWKKSSKKTSSKRGIVKSDWDEKMRKKRQVKELKSKLEKIKATKIEEKEEMRKKREEKRKRKEYNEAKSSVYQEIKNTSKIKKWNKKARKQLVKLPKELFYQKFGSGLKTFQ